MKIINFVTLGLLFFVATLCNALDHVTSLGSTRQDAGYLCDLSRIRATSELCALLKAHRVFCSADHEDSEQLVAMMRRIVAKKPFFDRPDLGSPVHLVACLWNEDFVELILDAAKSDSPDCLNQLDEDGARATEIAAYAGNVIALHLLVKHGAQIDQRTIHIAQNTLNTHKSFIPSRSAFAKLLTDMRLQRTRSRSLMDQRPASLPGVIEYFDSQEGLPVVMLQEPAVPLRASASFPDDLDLPGVSVVESVECSPASTARGGSRRVYPCNHDQVLAALEDSRVKGAEADAQPASRLSTRKRRCTIL